MTGRVVCADVGSTFTKVAVVDLGDGALVGSATYPTTVGTDVLDGLDVAVRAAGGWRWSGTSGWSPRAAQQVGLTAGARVVHVAAGRLDRAGLAELRAARPDVVLLVGGTDGGDAEVLVHNGRRLGTARLRVGSWWRATPDLVLTGVELLADDLGTDLAVVDVGGATTDVYSVLTPDGAPQPVAGTLWRTRTVEGDLGMRWSATGVVEGRAAGRRAPLGGCRASAPAATHRTVDLALVLVGETRQSDTPSPAGGMCDAR